MLQVADEATRTCVDAAALCWPRSADPPWRREISLSSSGAFARGIEDVAGHVTFGGVCNGLQSRC
jgi:hypothetical protein